MADILTTVDTENKLTIFSVNGYVTFEELAKTINSYFAVNPTLLILWDFSHASLHEISSSQIQMLAEVTKKYTDRRPGGKTALLFTSAFAFGSGRMFDTLMELSGSKVRYRSFLEKQSALEWLQKK